MTEDMTIDGTISSPDAFESALQQLVESAQENDIDPCGAWVVPSRDNNGDYEFQVVELADSKDSEPVTQ